MKTLVIAKKVVIELIRDKRTVLLMFVAPLLILCLLNLMFSASTKTKVTIGTVDVNNQINRKMDQVDGTTVKKYESEKHAKKALDANSLDGVISYKSKQYDVTYANLDVSKTVMTKKVLESALMKDNVSKLQSMVVKQGQVIAKLTGQQESVKMNKSKISIKNHYNYGNSKTNFFDKMAPILIGFFVFFLCIFNFRNGAIKRTNKWYSRKIISYTCKEKRNSLWIYARLWLNGIGASKSDNSCRN